MSIAKEQRAAAAEISTVSIQLALVRYNYYSLCNGLHKLGYRIIFLYQLLQSISIHNCQRLLLKKFHETTIFIPCSTAIPYRILICQPTLYLIKHLIQKNEFRI